MKYNNGQHAECLNLITHKVNLSIQNFQEKLAKKYMSSEPLNCKPQVTSLVFQISQVLANAALTKAKDKFQFSKISSFNHRNRLKHKITMAAKFLNPKKIIEDDLILQTFTHIDSFSKVHNANYSFVDISSFTSTELGLFNLFKLY